VSFLNAGFGGIGVRPLGVPLTDALPLAFGVAFTVEVALLGVLEKNPKIEAWFLFDEALELCFFNEGGGRAGVASEFMLLLAILYGVDLTV
jgi:hypothetical protein